MALGNVRHGPDPYDSHEIVTHQSLTRRSPGTDIIVTTPWTQSGVARRGRGLVGRRAGARSEEAEDGRVAGRHLAHTFAIGQRECKLHAWTRNRMPNL